MFNFVLSFEEFFKRLTGEKEKQIRPKRIEIMYETQNNSYEEDIGVANNLDELKNLIEKCLIEIKQKKYENRSNWIWSGW